MSVGRTETGTTTVSRWRGRDSSERILSKAETDLQTGETWSNIVLFVIFEPVENSITIHSNFKYLVMF